MPEKNTNISQPAAGENIYGLVSFQVQITPDLQERISAFTRTDEERTKFTQNALAMLADVYEGKRKMAGHTVRHADIVEEVPSFF